MNRYRLIILFNIILVFVIIAKVYACANEQPTAVISGSSNKCVVNGSEDCTITLDASESDDDGEITKYEWNYGDDGDTWDDLGTSTSTSHEYTTIGTYTVTLKVTDNGSPQLTHTTTCTVTVCELDKLVEWDYYTDEGPLFVPEDGSQDLFAFSYPSDSPYYVYFPSGYPVWSIIDSPPGSSPLLSTWDSGCCYGGSTQDSATLYNLTEFGKYVVQAQAGPPSYGGGGVDTIDVIYGLYAEIHDIQGLYGLTPPYIIYGTGTSFTYDIYPSSGWTPDSITLQISPDGETYYVREVDLTASGVGIGKTYAWDGKDDSGNYVEPGVYRAWLFLDAGGDAFYTSYTGQFTIKPYVDIGNNQDVVLVIGNSAWNSITIPSTVNPPNGSYSWSKIDWSGTGDFALTSTNQSSAPIELVTQSSRANDVALKLTYTYNSISNYDRKSFTILTPVATTMIADNLDDSHAYSYPFQYSRMYYHQLKDQFGNIINQAGIPVVETFPNQNPPSNWLVNWKISNGQTVWIANKSIYAVPDNLGIAKLDPAMTLYQTLSVGNTDLSPIYKMDLDYDNFTNPINKQGQP